MLVRFQHEGQQSIQGGIIGGVLAEGAAIPFFRRLDVLPLSFDLAHLNQALGLFRIKSHRFPDPLLRQGEFVGDDGLVGLLK
jgi:hypothetical protein